MFSTGEFSRIARVSKRLLQFYDEEGLLRPARVDPETGYRRYSAHQLAPLNRILALKELGLSLGEIRGMLNQRLSPAELQQMLRQKQKQLATEANQALHRLRLIEARLQSDSHAPDLIVKSLPAEQCMIRSVRIASLTDAWEWILETAGQLSQLIPKRHISTFFAQIQGEGYETVDIPLTGGCVLAADAPAVPDSRFTAFRNRAKENVITVVQSGGPEQLHIGCGAIGRYIEAQGLRMAEPPREVFIGIPLPPRFEDAVIESQFPLRS